MKRYIISLLVLASTSLQAKDLSLTSPNFAFELGGSFNMISNFDPATNNIYNDLAWLNAKESMGFSGNFYLVANVHAKMVLKFGFEVLVPKTLNDMQGVDPLSTSTIYMHGKTTTYAMIPTVAWDMFYFTTPKFRAFIGAEIGYAMLRSINEWHYVSAIQAVGYQDFTERLSASSVSVNPYAGIEWAFVDRYSLVFKVGYRILKFRTLTATNGYTNGQDITVAQNSTVLNLDGNNRVYDFSGLSLAMAFRIYF